MDLYSFVFLPRIVPINKWVSIQRGKRRWVFDSFLQTIHEKENTQLTLYLIFLCNQIPLCTFIRFKVFPCSWNSFGNVSNLSRYSIEGWKKTNIESHFITIEKINVKYQQHFHHHHVLLRLTFCFSSALPFCCALIFCIISVEKKIYALLNRLGALGHFLNLLFRFVFVVIVAVVVFTIFFRSKSK